MITFTREERQFFRNILVDRMQDASKEADKLVCGSIFNKLLGDFVNLTSQESGFAQYLMQELNEIYGSHRSVANEKHDRLQWVPTETLALVRSISDKLGSHLVMGPQEVSVERTVRGEGSISIMKDPTEI